MELIFEVIRYPNGGYTASCLNARVGDSAGSDLQELHDNLSASIDTHFEAHARPDPGKVHLLMFQD